MRVWTFTAPEGTDAGGLRELVTKGRDKARREIAVGRGRRRGRRRQGARSSRRPTRPAARRGASANRCCRRRSACVGGRGGGKDDMAQGGGTDVSDRSRRPSRRPSTRSGLRPGRDVDHTRRVPARDPDRNRRRERPGRRGPDRSGRPPRRARGDAGRARRRWPHRARTSTGIADLVEEYEPLELVVGLPADPRRPRGPGGERRPGLRRTTCVAVLLGERGCRVPVRLVDERLTTAAATEGCSAAGRDARSSRAVVDQAAAVIIVQRRARRRARHRCPAGHPDRPGRTSHEPARPRHGRTTMPRRPVAARRRGGGARDLVALARPRGGRRGRLPRRSAPSAAAPATSPGEGAGAAR